MSDTTYPSGPMAGPLIAGLSLISSGQEVAFACYIRQVLPLDGYVFWLRTTVISVAGSLHQTATKRQSEDELLAVNRIVFTTQYEVQEFNEIGPDHIWVGEARGTRFAFLTAGPRYTQSGIFHYVGDAVYPALASQLVEDGAQLSSSTLIVSNSLPAWLSLYTYNPIWISSQIPNPFVQLFPSFLSPENLVPPYGTVHISPDQTIALQATPRLHQIHTSTDQLTQDRVRVTLYGLTNDQAMAWTNLVYQFIEDTETIGLMSISAVRDEKRQQTELGIIAMKKTVDFTVSYNQGSIRTVARALIATATATVVAAPFHIQG